MKILKHPQRLTYRVLLRRDQTLKVACNHMITEVMELKPLSSSETALCWYAVDYADGEAKTEQLAVKFKLAETKNDFKAAFEAAQEEIRKKRQGLSEADSPTKSIKKQINDISVNKGSIKTFGNTGEDQQTEHDDYEDEDVSSNFHARLVILDRNCSFPI